MYTTTFLSLALFVKLVICWPRVSSLIKLEFTVTGEGQCTNLSFRDTQRHRDVPLNGSLVERSKTRDLVRIYGYDRDSMLLELSTICDDYASVKQTVLASADSFTLPLSPPLPPPPPLTIKPLIISGPSDNRVDLVFFSDGCAYIGSLFLGLI